MEIENEKKDLRNIHCELDIILFLLQTQAEKVLKKDFQVTTKEYDGNHTDISINKGKQVKQKIVVLQVLQMVKIISVYDEIYIQRIVFGIDTVFKSRKKNYIRIKDLHDIESSFQKGKQEYIQQVFHERLFRQYEYSKRKLMMNQNYIIDICKYLPFQDILAYLSANHDLYKNCMKNQEFWRNLYHKRFRFTGFSLGMLNWQKAFFFKENDQ